MRTSRLGWIPEPLKHFKAKAMALSLSLSLSITPLIVKRLRLDGQIVQLKLVIHARWF